MCVSRRSFGQQDGIRDSGGSGDSNSINTITVMSQACEVASMLLTCAASLSLPRSSKETRVRYILVYKAYFKSSDLEPSVTKISTLEEHLHIKRVSKAY